MSFNFCLAETPPPGVSAKQLIQLICTQRQKDWSEVLFSTKGKVTSIDIWLLCKAWPKSTCWVLNKQSTFSYLLLFTSSFLFFFPAFTGNFPNFPWSVWFTFPVSLSCKNESEINLCAVCLPWLWSPEVDGMLVAGSASCVCGYSVQAVTYSWRSQ